MAEPPAPSAPAPAPAEPARAPPPGEPPRRARAWAGALSWLLVFAMPLLVVAALVAAAVSALTTPGGTARLLGWIPGLTVVEPQGALLGDFSARQVRLDLSRPGRPDDGVTLEGLAWRGLRWARADAPGAWVSLQLDTLEIDRLVLRLPPGEGGGSTRVPQDLRLPLQFRLGALRVGELSVGAATAPVLDLQAALALGADQGRVHRLDGLSLSWDRLSLRGHAALGSDGELPLAARIDLAQRIPQGDPQGPAGLPWSARIEAHGPLARLPVQATLQAAGQSLEASATLSPFAAWPVDALQARFEALDLSALASAAPATALSGTAQAQLRSEAGAGSRPIEVNVRLRNARADRWDAGRLPLRSAEIRARSLSLDPADGLVLEAMTLSLGSTQREAGRLRGQGRWSPSQWQATLDVLQLEPSALDARAPAMRLSGPVTLASVPGRGPAHVKVQARLGGGLLAGTGPREVAVELAGEFSAERSQVQTFTARAGQGQLHLQGQAQHAAGQPVSLRAEARWQDVDPAVWWPALALSSSPGGAHRFNGQALADLAMPPRTPGEAAAAWFGRWQGQARLELLDSLAAGQPLRAQARWQGRSAQAGATIDGEVTLADNRLAWQGPLPGPGLPADDAALGIELRASQMDRLTPVLRALRIDTVLEGRLDIEGRIRWASDGTGWPRGVEGQLTGQALRLGNWRLDEAQGRWSLAPSVDASQQVHLDLKGLRLQERRIDTTTLRLEGSARAHQLRIEGRSDMVLPWASPAATGAAAANGTARAVELQLLVEGRADLPPGATTTLEAWTGWTAHLRQFALGPAAAGQEPWVQIANVPLRWERQAGALERFSLGAGQARLRAGRQVARLHWDELRYQAAQGRQTAVLQARAWLDPLPVAPLLREFQPGFGWKGDLEVGASLRLRSAPSFQADLEIARVRGDLIVEEAGLVETLDLSELRLALQARDGLWRFTQAMAGANLGRLQGEQTVQAGPQDWMPGPMAPLRGRLQADVGNLGAWAAWVPAGWRLGGQMQMRAELGGRLGAPEYTGEVRAREVVARNLLQGIHLRDGEVHLVLQGQTARIETLRARGGDGDVRITGGAAFGAQPRAELRLQAERFALLSRIDRRVVLSGHSDVVLEAQRLQANGSLRIDEGLIDISRSDAPRLSADVVVRRTVVPADEPPPRPPAQRRAIAIHLQLDAGDRLRLRGRGLDTRLAGALRLTTPGGRPTLNGDIRAVDGTYAAYGQKLTLEKGVISFVGDPANPRLDIEATRPNTDIRVGVAITGTAENPRVRLFSEPEMSETDKLSWLVLGRGSGQLARAEAALLQRAVLALVSGEGDAPGGGELTGLIGLDDISVRQEDSAGVAETIVSLGKQISRRWYVGYERSLNATSGSWQLIYRIAQRFTVRAQAGADENALDFIWIWRW